jgi:hypothetical protein
VLLAHLGRRVLREARREEALAEPEGQDLKQNLKAKKTSNQTTLKEQFTLGILPEVELMTRSSSQMPKAGATSLPSGLYRWR